MSEPLKVFISYSWKSEDYKAFVLELAKKLAVEEGFEVILDQWDLLPGHDMDYFMEDSIRRADKVLILCEKSYADKANAREGGVGTETGIITPSVYGKTRQEKFIPVLMEGHSNVPDYLRRRLGVSLGTSYTDKAYKGLCRAIRGEAAVPRPSRATVIPARPEQREAKKTVEPPAPVVPAELPTAQVPKEIESAPAPKAPAPVETPEQPTAQMPKEIESTSAPEPPAPAVTAESPAALVSKNIEPAPALYTPAPAVTAETPAAQVSKDTEPASAPEPPARNGGSAPAREFEYEPCPGGVAITKYKGAGGDVVIPAELDGQPVVKIAKQAFDYCESLRTVSIPDSVTAIGSSAFNHCTGLLYVKLPANLTRIGNSAFSECSSLLVISIPDGVESIGQWAFDRCSSLKAVTLPVSLKRIDFAAFRSVSLKNVYYRGTASQWATIVIDEENEALTQAVLHCYRNELTYYTPDGLFAYKTTHEGVTIAGYKGKGGSVVIPAEIDRRPVVGIEVRAFARCSSLVAIIIPDSVTRIESGAFESCNNLSLVSIPDCVIQIGRGAFMDCNSLKDVYYSGTVRQWGAVEIGSGNVPLLKATTHCRDVLITSWKPQS